MRTLVRAVEQRADLTYQRWISARHASPALRDGELELITPAQAPPALLGFVRKADAQTALVLHNVGDTARDVARPPLPGAPTPLVVDAGVTLAGARDHLPAHSSAVWILAGR